MKPSLTVERLEEARGERKEIEEFVLRMKI
jgi:hypothetical protein